MPNNRADLHGLSDLHAYPYAVHWHGQPGTALAYIDEGPPQAPPTVLLHSMVEYPLWLRASATAGSNRVKVNYVSDAMVGQVVTVGGLIIGVFDRSNVPSERMAEESQIATLQAAVPVSEPL